MTRIVVLEGKAINKGDLSWEPIERLGQVKIHKNTRQDQVIKVCKKADIIVVNKMIIDRQVIASLPELKLICEAATGYNNIQLEAATDRKIPVCNVPAYSTPSVAQHTFALILELASKVAMHSRKVHKGTWTKKKTWTWYTEPLIELSGKTIGIVGYGNIGRQVAAIARAFGMHVLVFHPHRIEDMDVLQVTWDELLQQSDIVSLHCPLREDNRHMVDARAFTLMQEHAWLINTARGGLIDEDALVQALSDKQIGGAGLDVLQQEPPPADHPLYKQKNCLITPHQAWSSIESRARLIDITAENIEGFLTGMPQNVVNPEA